MDTTPVEKAAVRQAKFELHVTELRIAIRLCLENKLTIPAMILLYSAIDAMAWLARPIDIPDVRSQDFEGWVDKYMLTPEQDLTARDLYAARCAMLHSHTAESRRSRSLFYASPAGAIMRVGVERGASWVATTPTMLVKEGYFASNANLGRPFDVSSDGQRFLMIKNRGSDQAAGAPKIIVVQHWAEELKRLVPTK